MRVLIYKRTHEGDPDSNGVFGCHDCMGRARNWNYDAVVGIGGSRPKKEHEGIRHKINWIGLNPKKTPFSQVAESTHKYIRNHIRKYNGRDNPRGDIVVFEHFKLYEKDGMNIEEKFPNLFRYMYHSRKRFDMSLNLPEEVLVEVKEIIDFVKDSPASIAYDIVEDDVYAGAETTNNTLKCSGCYGGEDMAITIQEC